MSVANLGLMRAFDEIARTAGVTYEAVVKSETQKILEAASKNTAAAQVKSIEAFVKGKVARTVAGKTYLMVGSAHAPRGWRLRDDAWSAVQSQISASIKRRKEARGLSKKSWKQIAERLGFDISVPSYVASATTRGGDYPENAQAREERNGSDFAINLSNSRTYSSSVFDAIRKAMNGREKFFRENMKTGVFKSIETIAAKYPGLNLK
jgi:hypothetical protein